MQIATAWLIPAAILTIGMNVYGWLVVPDETRIPLRWLVFGTRETTSKKAALVQWFLPECLILGGLAGTAGSDDSAMRWLGVGLLTYLLVLHFFTVRRLSRAFRA